MAYTGHGHQIAGTPKTGIPPKQVSRCGGPAICPACTTDAARVLLPILKETVKKTDFDVVAWYETEMRMMLDEEIAIHKATSEVPLVSYLDGTREVIGTASVHDDGTVSMRITSTDPHVLAALNPPVDDLSISIYQGTALASDSVDAVLNLDKTPFYKAMEEVHRIAEEDLAQFQPTGIRNKELVLGVLDGEVRPDTEGS